MDDNDGLVDLHDSRRSPQATLDTIIEWSRAAVQASEAGLFMLHPKGQVEVVVPRSPAVARAHDLQLELDEGPCLQVMRDAHQDSYIVGDTAFDHRFPRWGPAAAELGLRSVISSVLETPRHRYGSLNVYSEQAHAFDRDDLATIEIFSRRAARAITVADDSAGLTTALDTRKLIGQAQGILMERLEIEDDTAFAYLIRESQARNVKLRDVADWIVANRTSALADMDLEG